ncbi:alpha-2-macroglobulin-like protein 1 isoform X2 [Chrysemys picta bellii]|uniref:alpha-2-macroglobulin-like protein 1 isoform X2 n=1 Tax=Chrysemys picta bellii TaxID=8478 RepID=UPI0032B263F1
MINYAMAIPAQLFYPSSETVCIQVSRGQGVPVQVTVTLQTKTGNQTLITRSVYQPSFFDCTSFQDPKGNRIGQWLNVTPYQGIVDLFFPLAAEAPLGEYTINMPGLKNSFSVEDYVLPKCSVSIQMPPVITILEEKFHLQVCGT